MFYITIINCLVVALVVVVHYEFLYQLTAYFKRMPGAHRYRIVIGVLGALVAHTVEIWIFAFAYYGLTQYGELGALVGNFDGSLYDCLYYSFTVFSTLGFGDIEPSGELRFLTGIESLTGLLLIAWSASFLYFEMIRNWRVDREDL